MKSIPLPLTLVLTLAALTLGRGIRYTILAALGFVYGRHILRFFSKYYKPALAVLIGLAVIGTVVGEFLVGLFGPGEGLGVRIVSAKKQGRTDLVFAAVLIASLLGLAMFAGINLAAKLLLRHWHASETDQ